MLFNSYAFVFVFLPVCLVMYYWAVRREKETKYAKIWLIAMSLWFYGSFQLIYLLVLLGSVICNYGICRGMQMAGQHMPNRRKMIFVTGILGNLGLLFYFKYMNFFLENINRLFSGNLPLLQVLLPLGISFFTFQQISFLVDSYRGEIEDCGFLDYMLFITYFPKLVEGPIAMHSELLPAFKAIGRNKFDGERFVKGVALFVFGMLKKVILADTFGGAVNYGYENLNLLHSYDGILLVLFYSLQLYFDFSGYCDMARGISWMIGIELPVNFNSPYKAGNIVEFWKRWHITLNRFFTKYIYIPLGGNRKGRFKTYRNLLVVFLISGIWHGAGWNFILWGMLHGVLYVITRIWQQHRQGTDKGLKRIICVVFTFVYVSVAWVYFRADSVAQGNQVLNLILGNDYMRINKNLAGYFNLDEFWYILKVLHLDAWEYGHYILMFIITAFSLILVFFGKNAAQIAERIKPKAWTAVLLAGLFLWCILTFSNVSTFLYFNF